LKFSFFFKYLFREWLFRVYTCTLRLMKVTQLSQSSSFVIEQSVFAGQYMITLVMCHLQEIIPLGTINVHLIRNLSDLSSQCLILLVFFAFKTHFSTPLGPNTAFIIAYLDYIYQNILLLGNEMRKTLSEIRVVASFLCITKQNYYCLCIL
jgi:hypothetical protein